MQRGNSFRCEPTRRHWCFIAKWEHTYNKHHPPTINQPTTHSPTNEATMLMYANLHRRASNVCVISYIIAALVHTTGWILYANTHYTAIDMAVWRIPPLNRIKNVADGKTTEHLHLQPFSQWKTSNISISQFAKRKQSHKCSHTIHTQTHRHTETALFGRSV